MYHHSCNNVSIIEIFKNNPTISQNLTIHDIILNFSISQNWKLSVNILNYPTIRHYLGISEHDMIKSDTIKSSILLSDNSYSIIRLSLNDIWFNMSRSDINIMNWRTLCVNFWMYKTIFTHFWNIHLISDFIWHYLTISDTIWYCLTLSDIIWY